MQGFPDDWVFCGPIRERYRQIGNAVPVALGAAVGRAVMDALANRPPDHEWDGFRHSRYRHTSEVTWHVG